jgi:hypothetical protein
MNSDMTLDHNAAGKGADVLKDNEQKGSSGDMIEEYDVLAHSDSQILVHGREGCYLMDRCKWP